MIYFLFIRKGNSEAFSYSFVKVYLLLDLWTDNPLQWLIWQVVPQLSCPIALFTYYNPILKRGTESFMSTIRDTGVHGRTQHILICLLA